MPYLLLMLTVVPLAELYLLFQVGSNIGFFPTICFSIFTAALGSYLARRQALVVWTDWSQSLSRLESPAHSVLEGLMILVGGVLLLTPGFLTDAMGFSLLIPWTRTRMRRPVQRAVDAHLQRARASRSFVIHSTVARRAAPDVVDATFERLDDEPRQLH